MRRLLAIAAIVFAFPAQASTVTVGYTGTVFRITGDAGFVAAVPVTVGDAFSVSAEMKTNPGVSFSVTRNFYLDPFVSLTGTVGSYGFSMATVADAFRPIPDQQASVANSMQGTDHVSARTTISGATVGGFQPVVFQYDATDTTGTTLSSRNYDTRYFDQSYLDELALLPLNGFGRPSGNAQVQLRFKTTDPNGPTGSILIDVNAEAAQLAPVPLPASAWLLLAGVALLVRRRGLA